MCPSLHRTMTELRLQRQEEEEAKVLADFEQTFGPKPGDEPDEQPARRPPGSHLPSTPIYKACPAALALHINHNTRAAQLADPAHWRLLIAGLDMIVSITAMCGSVQR